MSGQRKRDCPQCGGKAEFAVKLPPIGAKPKPKATIPLVWECPCGAVTPLKLGKVEAS